jgi:hypothetical protein
MNNKFLLFTVKDLIINPSQAWEKIDTENKPVIQVRNGFLFPLSLLVAVSAFLGSLLYTSTGLSPVYSIFAGIECFILFFVSVYAAAYVLREISHAMNLGRNWDVSFLLIVSSIVPFMLCQMISRLFESLLFVDVLSLSGLYIFWIGAERMLAPPAHKRLPLLIATFVSFTAIFILTDYLFTKLFDKIFYTFFS